MATSRDATEPGRPSAGSAGAGEPGAAASPPPAPADWPSLTILIPAHNEGATITGVLVAVKSMLAAAGKEPGPLVEILVVDDGSSDDTRARSAAIAGVRVIVHPENLGYGAALKTGFREAKGEVVVTLDADGQHDPAEIPALVGALGEAVAMVSAARSGAVKSTLLRAPGKWLLSWTAQYLSGRKIQDLNCGLRAYRAAAARRFLHLCPNGFSISTTLLLSFLAEGYPVLWRPVAVRPWEAGASRVRLVRTGLATLLLLFRLVMLFSPLRVFLPASAGALLLGVGVSVHDLWLSGKEMGISDSAVLFFVVSVLIFLFGLVADSIAHLRREAAGRD